MARKLTALDTTPGTSSNRFAILSNNIPDGKEDDGKETLKMIIEGDINDSSKPPPIFLSDVHEISAMLTFLNTKINKEEYYYKSQRDG